MVDEEELIRKLDRLQSRMDELSSSLNRAQPDDYRVALYGQMSEILEENLSSLVEDSRARIVETSRCVNKEACIRYLSEFRDGTLAALQEEDSEGATALAEDSKAHYLGRSSPCRDSVCSNDTLRMLRELEALVSISDKLKSNDRLSSETNFARLSSQGRFFAEHRRTYLSELPSKETAELISPLSNLYRIEILKMLAKEELSFTSMSKALDLKTGHLQFHLKQLREAEYISANRRLRCYSITEKGKAALDGLHRFMEGVNFKEPSGGKP